MESKSFNIKSFWGRYSNLVFGMYPGNICKFRKFTILSLLTFPFWILPKIIIQSARSLFNDDKDGYSFGYDVLITVALFVFGLIFIGNNLINIETFNIFQVFLVSFLIGFCFLSLIVIALAAIFALGFGVYWLFSHIPGVKQTSNIISDSYKSAKDKIYWE